MRFWSSSNHFSTCPRASAVEILRFNGTISPSELFMWVMSSSSVNSSLAIPSKHFFKWGCTLAKNFIGAKYVWELFEKHCMRSLIKEFTVYLWLGALTQFCVSWISWNKNHLSRPPHGKRELVGWNPIQYTLFEILNRSNWCSIWSNLFDLKSWEKFHVCYKIENSSWIFFFYLVGSFVSDRISNNSSFDKKKNRGKYNRFFSKYSFKPWQIKKRIMLKKNYVLFLT